MEGSVGVAVLISVLLIIANGIFVAFEYGLVGARRSRIEALAKKGNRSAKALIEALENISKYVAGIQIGISMCGVGIGAIAEPLVTNWLQGLLGSVLSKWVSVVISVLLVTMVFVVIGELVPKYVTLQHAERVAMALVRPLGFVVRVLSPLVWVVQHSGTAILKLFRVPVNSSDRESISREELIMLIDAGESQGVLEDRHADVVSRALRFDQLDANDIMIHRLDIKWLDLDTPQEQLRAELGDIGHSRVPVCRGDIDDIVGVLYLQDFVKHLGDDAWNLEKILRPVEIVPENLTLNKVIERMREAHTQILVVVDEYGGTSGLITLEDVVEEVFGELDDQIESSRPAIEYVAPHLISARADVRYDELCRFLEVSEDPEEPPTTDTLANLIVKRLERMPKLGDNVPDALGSLRVENMARRRITRVRIQLAQDFAPESE